MASLFGRGFDSLQVHKILVINELMGVKDPILHTEM